MDYTAAPATALVATHCVLCGRPLVDAPSVECGMGPTCRERALVGAPDAARAEVNALVHRIAAAPDAADVPSLVAQIAAHGYATLAARLTERLAEGRAVTVRAEGDAYAVTAPYSEAFGAALREHRAGIDDRLRRLRPIDDDDARLFLRNADTEVLAPHRRVRGAAPAA